MLGKIRVLAVGNLVLTAGLVVHLLDQEVLAQPRNKRPVGRETGRAARNERPINRMISLLEQEMDMKDFQQPMKLKEALQLFSEKVKSANGGEELGILIDSEAFKAKPTNYEGDVYELEVKFPPLPRKMSLATALRVALSQIPTRDATYVVRPTYLEITTQSAVRPESLLAQPVTMQFNNRPLDEAVGTLADSSGLCVVLDPHAGAQLKAQVSATFANNASVGCALYVLADMAGLKAVVVQDAVYVTTPERAEALQKEQEPRKRSSSPARPTAAPQPGPASPAEWRAK